MIKEWGHHFYFLAGVSLACLACVAPFPARAALDLVVSDGGDLQNLYDDGDLVTSFKDARKKKKVQKRSTENVDELFPGLVAIDSGFVSLVEKKSADLVVASADDFSDVMELITIDNVPIPEKKSAEDAAIASLILDIDKRNAPKPQMAPDRLSGIVIVPSVKSVSNDDIFSLYKKEKDLSGANVQTMGFIDDSSVHRLDKLDGQLSNYIGQTFSLEMVDNIVADIKDVFRRGGKPFSNIYAPPQDVRDGVLFIVADLARVENITITGNEYFDTERILNSFDQDIGGVINVEALEYDAKALSVHPDRDVKVAFSPGSFENTTNVSIDVHDQKPWRVFGSRSNDGSSSLDKEQYMIGGYHNNLWGMDHKIAAQYVLSADGKTMEAYNLKYELPFYHVNNLVFSYAQSKTDTTIAGGSFDTNGEYTNTSIKYERYFVGDMALSENYILSNHKVYAGFDRKYIEGDILYNLIDSSIDTGIGADVKVVNLLFGYAGVLSDPYDGTSNIALDVVVSPGGMNDKNDDEDFETARENATADYQYIRFRGDRKMPVLAETFSGKNASLNFGFSSQLTADRLIGSERFVSGHRAGFRGYDSGAFSGDSGVSGYVELQTPSYNLIQNSWWDDKVYAKFFVDGAHFYNNDPVVGEVSEEALMSLGGSIFYTVNDVMMSELTYASDVTSKDKEDRQMIMYRLLFSY